MQDAESGTLINIFCPSVGKRDIDATEKMLAWLLKLKDNDGKLINIKRKSNWGNDPINQLKTYGLLVDKINYNYTHKEKTAFAVKKILDLVWDFYEVPM